MKKLILLILLLYSSVVRAEDVTLAWDASPDPVTGYRVFYNTTSLLINSTGASTIDVGKDVLLCVVPSLAVNTTYYFAVKALYYNNISGWSNQVVYTTAAIGKVPSKPVGLDLSWQ